MSPRTKKGWKWVKFLLTYMGSFAVFTTIAGIVSGHDPSLQKGVALLLGCIFLVVPTFILGWMTGSKDEEGVDDATPSTPQVHATSLSDSTPIKAARVSPTVALARPVITKAAPDDSELYGLVAKELASNSKDEGLWTMAFALESGDEAKTKAHYIRLRVAKLRHESVAQPVTQIAPQQTARAPAVTVNGGVSSSPANSKIHDVQYQAADKSETHLMQQAQQEFDSGQPDLEILAKAKSFAAGDATKIRDLYVRFRANALIDASSELQRSVEADRRRNIARAAKEVEAQQLAEKQRLDAISASPERIQLMSMVRRNQVELVRQLISVNPELVLAYDSEGRTALHLAVDEGAIDLIKVLLEFGANPSARDVAGRTPAELAIRKGTTLTALISGSGRSAADSREESNLSMMEIGPFGIFFNGDNYCWEDKAFDRLPDAIAYAERATKARDSGFLGM